MNDSRIIWERYKKLNEANLISTDPLHLELEKILKEKNVQKPQIKDWLLKTYIKWFKSPADDDQKTPFISSYQAKDTDPDWAKKEGIFQFNQFTPEYKQQLLHVIDFLSTKDEFYLKSLFKVTVPQMFQEVEKWDQEMERSAEKAKKAKLQSVEGTDYRVNGVYDGYPVWELISNKAFREESMYMGHCVGQAENESKVTSVEGGESEYFKHFKQHELFIYSLRDPKEHNHPAVTFELRRIYGQRDFKIVQIKGPANREVSERYRKACREFIEDNEFPVSEDGENIGMVQWNKNFYFEDSQKFKTIYHTQIIPLQKQRISEIERHAKYNNNEVYDVDLSNLLLEKLPDLRKIKINGIFNCSNNQLTTLEGAPEEVGGSFYGYANKLTSLEGAPQNVAGNFDCSNNQLITLVGAPRKINGRFNCYANKLTSLVGAPRKINGRFDCSYNQLTTLEGAPEEVGDGFDCYNNPVEFTQQDIQKAMQKSKEQNTTKLESFKEYFTEACWKNYKQVGMKKKGKKQVPNCVPK